MICTSCSAENVSDAKFCRQCGRGLGAKGSGSASSWVALLVNIVCALAGIVVGIVALVNCTDRDVYEIGGMVGMIAGIMGIFAAAPAAFLAGLGGTTAPQKRTSFAIAILLVGLAIGIMGLASGAGLALYRRG